MIDLWRCFAEGHYSSEPFRRAGYVERLLAYDLTDNCEADIQRVIELVRPSAALRVLDFGCGIGTLAARLAARGCRVTGADVSPEILEIARARHPEISFLPIDEVDGAYDVAISIHVLGVVPGPHKTLARMRNLLADNGRLVFCLPNPVFTIAMIPNNIFNDYLPDPTVLRCWSRRRIDAELSAAGFCGIEIETFGELPPLFRFDAFRSRLVGKAIKC